jgi:Icc-related predicted phosphoesterase
MKILAVGDPHGSPKIKEIPTENVDLILITGDIGRSGSLRAFSKLFFDNLVRESEGKPRKELSLKQQKKVIEEARDSAVRIVKYFAKKAPVLLVYGNHEYIDLEKRQDFLKQGIKFPSLTDELRKIKNIRILNNKAINFKAIKIGGISYFVDIGWVKNFIKGDEKMLKEAEKESEKVKKVLNKFGKVDILLTHQPPYGILDKINSPYVPEEWNGKSAGSKEILDYIKEQNPILVLCGHIHEAQGSKKINKTQVINLGAEGGYSIIEFN